MRKNYFFVLALMLGLGFNGFAQMQDVLKQVIVVNGGMFETEAPTDYVTVASFDSETGLTTVFDTIYTQSTQCVIVDEGNAYVSAQDSIMMYDLDTYERVAEVKMGGVNKLHVYQNYLIVGRQYPTSNKFVKILDKTDLSEVVAFEGISGDTYGITMSNDTAIVAVNGGWAGVDGKLVRIDMSVNPPVLIEELELGTQAMGIAQLYNYNNIVYSVNKTPWGGTAGSFTEFHTLTGQVTSTTIDMTVGNGVGLNEGLLYVMLNGNIGSFDLDTKEVTEDIIVDEDESLDILSAVFDEKADQFYVNFSSYFAAGEGKVFDLAGDEVDTYEVGISAEAIALDYRIVGSIEESKFEATTVTVYPNPCMEFVNIKSEDNINSIQIFDITGKQYANIQNVNALNARVLASKLKNGIYIVNINTDKETVTRRVIKK